MMFGKRADEAESKRICDAALDHGLNFFDTASMYQDGVSEQFLGRALAGRRDRCVVATKVGYGPGPDGGEEGLSREAIERCIDRSLSNLGMDHVDIFYLHRPDDVVPIEESLAAVADVIAAGKARFLGISNYSAWQSLEILHLCEKNGWPAPVMAQMIFNPLVRQIEAEYVSFCRKHDVYLTVYNPLAGGLLTGKYATMDDRDKGGRFVDNPRYENRYWSRRMFDGMNGLYGVAEDEGMSLTHLTLNWIAQTGVADNILLGPSNADQLEDCVAAGLRSVSDEGLQRIDAFLQEFDGTDAVYAR